MDHKLNLDRVKGPPLRPLCNTRLGPNAYLGNLQARFLRTVRIGLSKLINTEVCSTEELCYHIGQYNKLVKQSYQSVRIQPQRGNKAVPIWGEGLVIGSMNVAALYPNCKVKGTMQAIEEGTKLSGMEFEWINKGFLTKFVFTFWICVPDHIFMSKST